MKEVWIEHITKIREGCEGDCIIQERGNNGVEEEEEVRLLQFGEVHEQVENTGTDSTEVEE